MKPSKSKKQPKSTECECTKGECLYCKTKTPLSCSECSESFCNNVSEGISHIIYHMVKTKHKILSINGEELKCIKCGENNLFRLGINEVGDLIKSIDSLAIHCQAPNEEDKLAHSEEDSNKTYSEKDYISKAYSEDSHSAKIYSENISKTYDEKDYTSKTYGEDSHSNKIYGGEDSNKLTYSDEDSNKIYEDVRKEIYCGRCNDLPRLVKNKTLSIFPSSQSEIPLKSLKDTVPIPKIKLYFDPKSYLDTFIPMIEAEKNKEKEVKENMRQENVSLSFKGEYCYFNLNRGNSDFKINVGDEVKFSYKNSSKFKGYVCEEQFSDQVKVKITTMNPVIQRGGYTIQFIWNGNTYRRMKEALLELYSKRRENIIFQYIMRGQCPDTDDLLSSSVAPSSVVVSASAAPSSAMSTTVAPPSVSTTTMPTSAAPSSVSTTTPTPSQSVNLEVLTPEGFCSLNDSQKTAVKAALSRTLTLVQGPPGTGKTIVSTVIVYNLVKHFKKRVLVVAPSNTAADQLAIKLNSTGIRVLRIMSKRREDISNEVDFLCLHNILRQFSDEKKQLAEKRLLELSEVICCTCTTAGKSLLRGLEFPFVLIDEAVQSTEPLSLIPCVYNPKKLILVGDHKQLGPTILNKDMTYHGYKQSLFERLLKIGVPSYMLSIQYRMHPDLCSFPSEYFYGGLLQSGTSAEKVLDLPNNFFYVCDGKEETSQNKTSFINKSEAAIVENIIRFLFKNGVLEQQIGVITPYEGQRSHILGQIFGNEPGNIEIKNVDGFQGREKDFIIVSLVRSNISQGIGFVGDKRRMNVTLTRAKHGLIIVGNPFTLYKNKIWADLLNWYDLRGMVYEGPLNGLRPVSLKSLNLKEE